MNAYATHGGRRSPELRAVRARRLDRRQVRVLRALALQAARGDGSHDAAAARRRPHRGGDQRRGAGARGAGRSDRWPRRHRAALQPVGSAATASPLRRPRATSPPIESRACRAPSRSRILAVAALLAATRSRKSRAPPSGQSPCPRRPRIARLPGVDQRQCGTQQVVRAVRGRTVDAVLAHGRTGEDRRLHRRLPAGADGRAASCTPPIARNCRGKRRGGEAVLFGTEGIAFRTRDKLPPADAVIDYLLVARRS